ncbi:MAG: hydroxyacid dehydrogenase [Lentisphaeria bacterium]|nr:hydroxyacid dehydrogenase [Lentisphaeria bacterium]
MKKYKAMFVCARPENIGRVYDEAQRKTLSEITEMFSEIVTPANFDSFDLTDREVIFSTWGMMNFTDEQLSRLPRLEAVFYGAGATDTFARPLLKRNIKIMSAWKANAVPVAEFTAAQIVLSMKNYFSNTWENRFVGPGCYGEKVALLGAGAISKKVQELLKNYRLEVMVVPSRPEHRTVSLEEAFRTAYVVSNHLPDREDNQKVITKAMFESMRHGATFINTGRGRQVDEEGMIQVLKKRPDLTALLDVLTQEPPQADSELRTLPNVRLSSHIAGSLNDELRRMSEFVIEDFRRFAQGEPMLYEIREEMLLTSGNAAPSGGTGKGK